MTKLAKNSENKINPPVTKSHFPGRRKVGEAPAAGNLTRNSQKSRFSAKKGVPCFDRKKIKNNLPGYTQFQADTLNPQK